MSGCLWCCRSAGREWMLVGVCLGLLLVTTVRAGEVTTNSGFTIPGRPLQVEGLEVAAVRASRGNTNVKHVWMIDDGMRRYFVPSRQVRGDAIDLASLEPYEEYTLRHQRSGRSIGPAIVGSFVSLTPFDEYGRRVVTLAGGPDGDIPIHQAITRLRPDYVTVESTSHNWTHGLSTWTIHSDVLLPLLKQAIDSADAQQRLGIVRFLIDAQMYSPAQLELADLRAEFPEMAGRIDETQRELAHYIALKALNEIRLRQAAGQHRLAYAVADGFPQEMVSADLRRGALELAEAYRRQADQIERARMMLSLLEAELTPEQAEEVRPLRSILSDQLTFDTLERLEPFLRAEPDDTLQAEEKLALAYSGWLLGASSADLSFSAAVRLWRARFLVLQYLRSGQEADRRSALSELYNIDGVTVPVVAAMISRLTPVTDDPPPAPGVPMTVELRSSAADGPVVRYSVILPLEYSPLRTYPLIVALRSQGASREQALSWWAGTAATPGQAMKRGYIVIAPEYAEASEREYAYGSAAQAAVIAAIQDARKRFAVNSNRIFLGGHGMGGDAAFDIGMSHADLFAGVLPIAGLCDKYCKWTWDNSALTAWYVVGGERDRNTLEVNAGVLMQMIKRGYDLVYAEYMERGYESYFEELPRMFDWMELHQRPEDQREFAVDALRPTETDWYWLSTSEFPQNALQPVVWDAGVRAPRPQRIRGTITPGNTIIVGSGGKRMTIQLSPELIDFEQRVEVKQLGRSQPLYRDFVKPDVAALLDDLRERGDRQRLYWAALSF